ncbi:type II toxin-antitoxin system RelE/ParE family toxin [Oleomonas cavernae]|uniref:Type II toxin-antitoxin system RelE/ParE family toxin n=1 Tax=Oleomonas cavernae TaxID=2320859 RepID=A0A418WBV8_9PROT|nr:type II toxin-antitoxin system RelE/ParE family toxin [Oleomonas cavernae]RJF87446.1 type II toxin-antitoxin system RelE/ParE family toxin [Oleomonas cavernae]
MALRIEFSAWAERDFDLILTHLFDSYRSLGETAASALDHAGARTTEIRAAAERILAAPHRGTMHDDILPGLRHLTIERAIYWFRIDEPRQIVQVIGVFFGGQDHVRRMYARLLEG